MFAKSLKTSQFSIIKVASFKIHSPTARGLNFESQIKIFFKYKIFAAINFLTNIKVRVKNKISSQKLNVFEKQPFWSKVKFIFKTFSEEK